MNLLLAIPIELRFVGLFLLGAVTASFLNLAIYRWAWQPRSISPWSAPPAGAPPRNWSDRIPIVGWLGLRREAAIHGRGFWVRPMLLEFATGIGFAWLYWWEVGQQALFGLPPAIAVPAEIVHFEYISHLVLIALMLIASFIDIDEKIIPDEVTVPGTLLGLLLAAVLPWSLLPHVDFGLAPPAPFAVPVIMPGGAPLVPPGGFPVSVRFLTLAAPNAWPQALGGWPHWGSLGIGLGCYGLWCFAILPRPWYPRHGVWRAMQISTARLFRGLRTVPRLFLLVLGSLAIGGGWWAGGQAWAGLLTALVGLAASGGVVWAVRIIGAVTLRKEAMGFGDVLLMMMIGTFLGWQACLIVFFLAPIAGLVLGVVQYILIRDQVIPYGPFLCVAALAVILGWAGIWQWAQPIFAVGWMVPVVLVVCFALMAVMLLAMRLVREALYS